MYSKFFLKYVIFFYKLAHHLYVIPFCWNPKTKRVEITPEAFTKVYIFIINLLFYCVVIFPFNLKHGWNEKTKDFAQINFALLLWLSNLMGFVQLLMCYCNAEEICLVFNGYCTFLQNFAGKFLKNILISKN